MFSGQGSQYFQMGRTLYHSNPIFRETLLQLDDIMRELSGSSVIEAIYSPTHGPGAPFERTLLSHPAIFMVEYSLARALIGAGVVPGLTLGTSVGSFAAATLAGCIAPGTALTAVVRQAQALEECCEPGGMIAVLGSADLYEQPFLRSASELASVNFASHFVVSAPRERCEGIERELSQRGIPFQRLPVSFAFHSRWIDPARNAFEAFMEILEEELVNDPQQQEALAAD